MILFIWAAVIQGVVLDENNKPLPYCDVYIEGENKGSATDESGYFRISNVRPGKKIVVFSMLGYEEKRKEVNIKERDQIININVKLKEKVISIDKPVKITAKRSTFLNNPTPGVYHVKPRIVAEYPSFVQNDVFKLLKLFPGVINTSDFSSGLYVRGGSQEQNLILLDNIRAVNPFHLGGLFSGFENESLEEVKFYTGGFPVMYGGRLSSVLLFRTYSGQEGNEGKMELNTMASSFKYSFKYRNFSSYIFLRRTYFDKVLSLFNWDFPYYFYDGILSSRLLLGKNIIVKSSHYGGEDIFNMEEGDFFFRFNWENRVHTLNISYLGEKFLVQLIGGYTHFYTEMNLVDMIKVSNSLNSYTLLFTVDYKLLKYLSTNAGFEIYWDRVKYDANFLGITYHVKGEPVYRAGFFEAIYSPISVIKLKAGFRYNYYYTRYHFTNEQHNISPRFSLKYFLTPDFSTSISMGDYYQYYGATIPERHLTSMYYWIPIYDSLKPQRCRQVVAGIDKWLSEQTDVKFEIFYKDMPYLLQFNQEELDFKNMSASLFEEGEGYAYGFDVFFRRDEGNPSAWLSYTYSVSIFIDENGEKYYTSFDRRHNFNIIINYKLPYRFKLSCLWTYGTGLPYTGFAGRWKKFYYDQIDDSYKYIWVPIDGKKNGNRYPPYHRLDLGVERNFYLKKLDITLKLQVINLYNNKNIILYTVDYSKEPPEMRSVSSFPIFPFIGVEVKF